MTKKMILVDAVNTFVNAKGEIYEDIYQLLEEFSENKVILTNADDSQLITFGLDKMPYPVFTLKHNPEKTDPQYFETFLDENNLKPEDVIYFEHNIDAVKSAQSVGISSFHFDKDKRNVTDLKEFLENGLKHDINQLAIKHPLPPNANKVFSGVIFDVFQWEQEMYDGSLETFEKLKRPYSVVVIPVTRDKKIVVNHEEQPHKGKFINVPGGRIEEGETAIDAGRRELLEETGYKSQFFKEWFSIQPTSKIDYIVHFVVAQNCEKIQGQQLDKGEKIQTQEVNFDEFYHLVLDPNFADKELKLELLLAEKKGRLEEVKNFLLGF